MKQLLHWARLAADLRDAWQIISAGALCAVLGAAAILYALRLPIAGGVLGFLIWNAWRTPGWAEVFGLQP